MGTPAPDAIKRLADARDMTEMSDISDRVPGLSDRKVFLSGDYREEQLRLEFLNPLSAALGWDPDDAIDIVLARNRGSGPLSPGARTPLPETLRLMSEIDKDIPEWPIR